VHWATCFPSSGLTAGSPQRVRLYRPLPIGLVAPRLILLCRPRRHARADDASTDSGAVTEVLVAFGVVSSERLMGISHGLLGCRGGFDSTSGDLLGSVANGGGGGFNALDGAVVALGYLVDALGNLAADTATDSGVGTSTGRGRTI
jgi:hypothetical protein